MTSEEADPLVVRPRPIHDDAVPNANGVFAEALVRLAQITGADEDRQDAEQTLATLTGIARDRPLRPHLDPQRPRPALAGLDHRDRG